MDTAALVSIEVTRGSEVVRALDSAGVKLNAALWAVLPEYGDWRLVLASRRFDLPDPREGYGLLHVALDAAGFTPRTTPTILILPTTDPFVKALRKRFGKTSSVEGMRLGGQMIGDRFFEDAYVYRIS
ncbi:MAG: hypothetical protein HY820_33715 [Acidobacteria bacterium]|nr:hypothetical protein [Acidobacteriota bacterium]